MTASTLRVESHIAGRAKKLHAFLWFVVEIRPLGANCKQVFVFIYTTDAFPSMREQTLQPVGVVAAVSELLLYRQDCVVRMPRIDHIALPSSLSGPVIQSDVFWFKLFGSFCYHAPFKSTTKFLLCSTTSPTLRSEITQITLNPPAGQNALVFNFPHDNYPLLFQASENEGEASWLRWDTRMSVIMSRCSSTKRMHLSARKTSSTASAHH